MNIKSVIRKLVNGGGARRILFKPGYKTGRNQYMCRTEDRALMFSLCEAAGLTAVRLPGTGRDYNYGGDLYTVAAKTEFNGIKDYGKQQT